MTGKRFESLEDMAAYFMGQVESETEKQEAEKKKIEEAKRELNGRAERAVRPLFVAVLGVLSRETPPNSYSLHGYTEKFRKNIKGKTSGENVASKKNIALEYDPGTHAFSATIYNRMAHYPLAEVRFHLRDSDLNFVEIQDRDAKLVARFDGESGLTGELSDLEQGIASTQEVLSELSPELTGSSST